MIPASEALERLCQGNRRFVTNERNSDVGHERRAQLTDSQQPFAIILGCADSRVPAEIVFESGWKIRVPLGMYGFNGAIKIEPSGSISAIASEIKDDSSAGIGMSLQVSVNGSYFQISLCGSVPYPVPM